MLEDGTYDALVVDVTGEGRVLHLDLTIVGGPHKGEVVSIRAEGLAVTSDPVDLLGLPATLVVEGGAPRIQLEP